MNWIVKNLWLIPALPMFAAGIGALLKQRSRIPAACLAIGSMVLSFLLSLAAFAHVLGNPANGIESFNFDWFQFGDEWLQLGWVLDPLTAIMLVMVTFVGLLIFIYSVGYMAHDENSRGSSVSCALFAGAMLGVVIANSLLLFFICWEIVGLTSYLLIGFWYSQARGGGGREKSLHHHAHRRPRLAARHGLALRAERTRCSFMTTATAVLKQPCSGASGRARHRRGLSRLHRHRPADLLRRGRQIRPGAAARLAAGRDGRPHARQRADPRGHHGGRRRLPRRARLSADGRANAGRSLTLDRRAAGRHLGRRHHRRFRRAASPSRKTTSSASSPTPPFRSLAT